MAYSLIKKLAVDNGVYIKVFLFNSGVLHSLLKQDGIEVEILDERKLTIIDLIVKLRKFISTDIPAIIHSHGYKENIVAGFAALGKRTTVALSTMHGLPEKFTGIAAFRNSFMSRLNIFILRWLFRSVVCVSHEIGDRLRVRFPENHIATIHNGLEINKKLPSRKHQKVFTIGSAGRLCKVKNFSLMAKIAALVNRSENVLFYLAGDGPDADELRHAVEMEGLNEKFIFLGAVNDMQAFYSSIDLYINTSFHEGIPMTFLEAMECGIPVVAPRTGGIPEVVRDNIDGILIDNWNAEMFADAILKLKNDKDRYAELSNNSYQRIVRSFSLKQCSDMYYGLYNEVITQ
jgi:glycosyltransferase involved in cell wall biosynthesis